MEREFRMLAVLYLDLQWVMRSYHVPFLVTNEKILNPILGFNIISSFAKIDDMSARTVKDDFVKSFED